MLEHNCDESILNIKRNKKPTRKDQTKFMSGLSVSNFIKKEVNIKRLSYYTPKNIRN